MPKPNAAPKNRLKNLRAFEVSCVKSGANRRKWAVIKSEDSSMPEEPSAIPPMLSDAELADVRSYIELRNQVVAKADAAEPTIGEKEEAALEAVRRIVGNFKDTLTIADLVAMGAQAGLSGAEDDDFDDDEEEEFNTGDIPDAPVTQTSEPPVKVDKDMNWQMPKPEGVSDADHADAMKAAKAAYLGKMGKTDKADDGEDEDAVEKACEEEEGKVTKSAEATEQSAEYFANVQKRHEAVLAKCAELEGRVAAMQDEKILKSYEERLAQELPNLSIDRTATARVLKSLSGDQVAHDSYLATLKAAHEQVAVAKSYGGNLYGSSRGAPGQFAGFAAQNAPTGQSLNGMIQEQIKKSGNSDTYAAWKTLIKNPEFAALYEQNSLEEQ